jgi:hypothetical protein
MDSVVFDLCRGPGTVAQVVCSRSRAHTTQQKTAKKENKKKTCFLHVNSLKTGTMLPLLALLLAATLSEEPTLLDAFRAFAECEGDEALRLLQDRLSFFHQTPTEEHVRSLPQHAARNEQEQVSYAICVCDVDPDDNASVYLE